MPRCDQTLFYRGINPLPGLSLSKAYITWRVFVLDPNTFHPSSSVLTVATLLAITSLADTPFSDYWRQMW